MKYTAATLPLLIERTLSLDMQGADVFSLNCALMGLGIEPKTDDVSDVFTSITQSAVIMAQSMFGLPADGEVSTNTKKAIEVALTNARQANMANPSSWNGTNFAAFVKSEVEQNLSWTPALKYIQPFVAVLGEGRWSWCGATQYWLLNQFLFEPSNKSLPITFAGNNLTFAYVDTWRQWGLHNGWYVSNSEGFAPPPGAFALFDWHKKNYLEPDTNFEDHIGCVIANLDKDHFESGEGNTDQNIVPAGRTAVKLRNKVTVKGYVIIPESWSP